MHIRHQTIEAPGLQTIVWAGDEALMDWASGGQRYELNGVCSSAIAPGITGVFDCAITSVDEQYAFIYQKTGTRGVLLKAGIVLREISRADYYADVYEYPAAFATLAGTTYLIHCPVQYCQLDFEAVETGELVTNIPGRAPRDAFHSRLEVSPDGGYLLSKGWYWHPWDMVEAFDMRACLANPLLLDATELRPGTLTELCSAAFATEHRVLLAASEEEPMDDERAPDVPPNHLGFWDLKTNVFSDVVQVNEPVGNVFPISPEFAWDLYQHPKIISLITGEIVARLPGLATGEQRSAIIHQSLAPAIAFNHHTKRIALKNGTKIEVLSAE